jgi:hypothetical protein
VPGGQGSSPICLLARRPCAVGAVVCDQPTRASTRPRWLGPASARLFYALSGVTVRTHHPFLRVTAGDITTTLPALRRHALATAWPVESIDRAPSTTSATRSFFSHDRPDRRYLDRSSECCHIDDPVVGRAPLLRFRVPCNARWLRSRCPGRPASGRSRFGVSIPVGPRAFCSRRPADRMIFRRPCGFPLERIPCDEARVADA